MVNIDTIKELMALNLEELQTSLNLNLSIDFKDDEINVLYNYKNIILSDKLSNYGVDFESQKKFILNVADKIFGFAEFGEEDESELTDEMVKHIKMKTAIEKKVLGVDINIDEYIVTINYIDEKGSFKNHSLLLYCKNIEKE